MSTTGPRPMPARSRALGRVLLIGIVALISLATLEGAFRLWLMANGRSYSRADAGKQIADLVAGMNEVVPSAGGAAATAPVRQKISKSWSLHPFFGFTNVDFLAEAIEAAGRPRDESQYVILILGGSVSAQIFRSGGDRLRSRLEADPHFAGKTVRLLNGGAGAYKQPQQVNVLVFLTSLGLRPDAVINIDGFNEVATSNDNARHGVHPIYPSWFHWQHLITQERLDSSALDALVSVREAHDDVESLAACFGDSALLESSILGELVLARMRAARRQWYQAHQAYNEQLAAHNRGFAYRGPPFEGGLEETLNLTVRIWEEASVCLQTMCAGRSIRYLHVLQPTLHDAGSKPLTDQEVRGGQARPSWVEGTRVGYPMLRVAAGWLREHSIDFLDCSMIFAGEQQPIYIDSCHYNTHGCEMVADRIAERLISSMEK